MTERELFFRHLAQTSPSPLALEMTRAEGCYLFGRDGKKWLDMIGGISVANTGHRHHKVIKAIQDQLEAYLHVMVYAEFIESPQVQFARLLTENLPGSLDSVYFTNSGAEATEGAMKLAKRVTGRTNIIAFNHSYHGSTQGALSILGDEEWRNAFRPLLPGISHFNFNSAEAIDAVNEFTACVILETIQGEAGIIAADEGWIQALRTKCTETGCLLILDEIQAGFGRTGKLWGFDHYNIVPDILLLGKALGGGMPLGAFIANKKLMDQFMNNPVLGHITTFGGHPVSCAAGLSALKILLEEDLIKEVKNKEAFFLSRLRHSKIKEIRNFGLWMAIQMEDEKSVQEIVQVCIRNGVLIDWFLFAPHCIRISPPLTVSLEQLEFAANILLKSMSQV